MFCRNCGQQIPEGQNFCPNCGTKLISQPTNNSNYSFPGNDAADLTEGLNQRTENQQLLQQNSKQPVQQMNLNTVSENDELTEAMARAYVGEEKADFFLDKFKNGGIVWQAILFSGIYFFYRRNFWGYIYITFLISIVCGVLNNILPSLQTVFPLIQLLGIFLVGLAFIPTYKKKVYKKVEQIKKKNPTCTQEELIGIAKVMGGVSVNWLMFSFAGIIVEIALIPVVVEILLKGQLNPTVGKMSFFLLRLYGVSCLFVAGCGIKKYINDSKKLKSLNSSGPSIFKAVCITILGLSSLLWIFGDIQIPCDSGHSIIYKGILGNETEIIESNFLENVNLPNGSLTTNEPTEQITETKNPENNVEEVEKTEEKNEIKTEQNNGREVENNERKYLVSLTGGQQLELGEMEDAIVQNEDGEVIYRFVDATGIVYRAVSYADSEIKVGDTNAIDDFFEYAKESYGDTATLKPINLYGKDCYISSFSGLNGNNINVKNYVVFQDVGTETYLLVYVADGDNELTEEEVLDNYSINLH